MRRARIDRFLPTPPVPAQSDRIASMPLAERVRRKIVPQRGFCSIAPADQVRDALVSGNGAMSIELMGDPYAERILFHHEGLLMPWKSPWRRSVRHLCKRNWRGRERPRSQICPSAPESEPDGQDTSTHDPGVSGGLIFTTTSLPTTRTSISRRRNTRP
jgi:hypothetical protein